MNIVKAKLVKRISDDGNIQMLEDVPLGKIYEVDMDTRVPVQMFNTETGQEHTKEVVFDADGKFLPMELLEVVSENSQSVG